MMAQEAALKETTDCVRWRMLVRLTARRSKWGSKKSAILDIDETGDMAKFQSQTFTVARDCVCRQVALKNAGDLDALDGAPSATLGEKSWR